VTDDTVLVPGGRDVRATLDRVGAETDADACVVACPPHPHHRGHRGDERLRAVSDVLVAGGVDCLRFDYGDWDEGYGERADVRNAVEWARERYERVGLFGYSFGATLALLVASEGDVDAVSALSPTDRVDAELDAVAALDEIPCPTQVAYGKRDETVEWRPVVERARELGFDVRAFDADHFFVGQAGAVGEVVGEWLVTALQAPP
jgi:alpha/beta superfamily hydrolase